MTAPSAPPPPPIGAPTGVPMMPPPMSAPMAAPVSAPAGAPVAWTPRPAGKRRNPWAVWLLSYITFGIYYLVWFAKINGELQRFAPEAVKVKPGLAAFAQIIPIANWVGLARTAGRINAAHAAIGSPTRASGAMAILSSFWVLSQTRYLQRRVNALWDAVGAA